MFMKTCKTAVCASALMAVAAWSGGAFAEGISESFEGKTAGDTLTSSTITGLTGNGTYAAGGAATAPAMGFPISGNHAVALEIAGTVTYTEAAAPTTTGASQVDLMFKVEPTDELEDPTGNDVRVAFAVGTNNVGTTTAPIKLWCKTASGGSAEWVTLNNAVATGSWMRATIVLDYGNNKCSVSLNGDPALNGSDKWFFFANNGGSYVSSIAMVGSTMVDDLVVTHTALDSFAPTGGNQTIPGAPSATAAVTYEYINKYGITTNDVVQDCVVNETSGMKVSEKFVAGLDPKSDTKFEMKTMTTTKNSVTVTFPGNKGNGSYTLKVGTTKGGSNVATQTSTQTSNSGEGMNQAQVSIPSNHQDELLYFTVETN